VALWKPHNSAQEGAGDRAAMLAWLAVSGAPCAGVGQDADLGVAVERHSTIGAENLLPAAVQVDGNGHSVAFLALRQGRQLGRGHKHPRGKK
jgi:hypothetical protein